MGNRSAIIGLILMFSMLAYAEDPGKAPPASTKKDAAQQTKATPGFVPEKDVKGASGQDESPKVPAKVTWLDCFSQDMQVTAQQQGLRLGGTLEVSSQGKCAQAILDSKDKESLILQLSGVSIPSLAFTKRTGLCYGWLSTDVKMADSQAKDAATEVKKAEEEVKNAGTEAKKTAAEAKKAEAETKKAAAEAKKTKADAEAKRMRANNCDESTANQLLITFFLKRDTGDGDNRKAWILLLDKLSGGDNKVNIAIALGTAPAVLVEKGTLQFQSTKGELSGLILAIAIGFFVACFLGLAKLGALSDRKTALTGDTLGVTTFSLGKTQMAFWALLVASAFLGIFFSTGTTEVITNQMLVLLGISATTGLGSVLVGNTKPGVAKLAADASAQTVVDTGKQAADAKKAADEAAGKVADATTNGTLTKADEKAKALADATLKVSQLNANDAKDEHTRQEQRALLSTRGNLKFLTDILSDGDGNVSVNRFQAFLWTVVLGITFVYTTINTLAMPDFSTTLLTLIGISNSTYLGFKFADSKPSTPNS